MGLRIHKVSKEKTEPRMQQEIRQFMETVFSDKNHNLTIRETPKELHFYINWLRRRPTHGRWDE